MLCSMTAFASAAQTSSVATVSCEIRSVNSRFLDLNCRLPQSLPNAEERLKALVGEYVQRGRIDIKLQITETVTPTDLYEIDWVRARGFMQALEELKQHFNLETPISLQMLVTLPGLIRPAEVAIDPELLWPAVESCLRTALAELQVMRQREGQTLAADIQGRLQDIETGLRSIDADAAEMLAHYQARLTRRMQKLTGGLVAIEAERVAQEAAFLAERSDISEELIRAQSHCEQFTAIMQHEAAAGRKLNFLLQELNREITTIGAKAEKVSIARQVIHIKAELEKIREQIQNIE